MAHNVFQGRLRAISDAFVRQLIEAFTDVVTEIAGMGSVVDGGRPTTSKAAGQRRTGRRGRRSPADTATLAQKIAAHVAKNPNGIRVEPLGKALKMPTSELALPIKKALAAKLIAKRGQRRGTVYLPGKKK